MERFVHLCHQHLSLSPDEHRYLFPANRYSGVCVCFDLNTEGTVENRSVVDVALRWEVHLFRQQRIAEARHPGLRSCFH